MADMADVQSQETGEAPKQSKGTIGTAKKAKNASQKAPKLRKPEDAPPQSPSSVKPQVQSTSPEGKDTGYGLGDPETNVDKHQEKQQSIEPPKEIDETGHQNGEETSEAEGEAFKEQRDNTTDEQSQASGSHTAPIPRRGKDAASSLSQSVGDAKAISDSNMADKAGSAANKTAGGGLRQSQEAADNITDNLSSLEGLEVGDDGEIRDQEGKSIGKVVEGDPEDLGGQVVGSNGEILDEEGDLIGRVELLPKQSMEAPTKGADVTEQAEGALKLTDLANLPVNEDGTVKDQTGRVLGRVVEGDPNDLAGQTVDEYGEIMDEDGDLIGCVELVSPEEAAKTLSDKAEGGKEEVYKTRNDTDKPAPDVSILEDKRINKRGKILDEEGDVLGQIVEGYDTKILAGKSPDGQGQVRDNENNIIGQVEVVPGEAADEATKLLREKTQKTTEAAEEETPDISVLKGLKVNAEGQVISDDGKVLGEVESGELSEAAGKIVNEQGMIVDDKGNEVGKVRQVPERAVENAEGTEAEEVKEAAQELPSISTLEGLRCNKLGSIINADGVVVGELVEGDSKKISHAGVQLDDQGQFWDSRGNVIGRAQTILPTEEEAEGPFAGLPDIFVIAEGWVQDGNGNRVGKVVDGDVKKLIGRTVDDDGDILDKKGNIIGHAEPWEEEEPEEPGPEPEPEKADYSVLAGLTPNKMGNVPGPDGYPIARVTEGNLKAVAGKGIDKEGQIWNDTGKVIGRVELIPESEREAQGPFSGYEDLVVNADGFVEDSNGTVVGKVIEGDFRKLRGQAVDDDGEIVDKHGNVRGRAEPYELPEEEEEDLSALEGKTVNKLGNVVDDSGAVLGRITSGNPKKLAGKKVDKTGQIWSDDGKVIGQAELIPAAEREKPEGEFFGFEGLIVAKDGMIQDPTGQTVGRLVEGNKEKLVGRAVDEDGEILDKSGNVIGHGERWSPEEKKRDINPMAGRKVNNDGEVRDEDGNLIGKLTQGDLQTRIGKTIDDNGYVVDNDGNKIGECTLLENLPDEPDEPELSPEELEKQQKEKEDRELAKKMCAILRQAIDSIEPLCKQITEHIEKADRTPKEELDEEQLVQNVKPLIEEAGNMLQECKGALRGLDPDGQVAATAKARSASHEATPEEYELADLLKQLTQTIVTTIDNGRKRIADMPHAKKKINPLWALLSEPLFQIIAAVGLLLSGVLGIVSRLLDGLGLGGLLRGLLGGLGIDKLLEGFGLGTVTDTLGLGS